MSLPSELLPADGLQIVCLPDLFLDHVIHLPPIGEAEQILREIHEKGGGKVLDVAQQIIPGGNAANTAHALARLGAQARLAGRTSERGRVFFEDSMGSDGVDLDLVRDDGELAATAVLAFGPEGTNVMLNDSGSVRAYGPQDITQDTEQAIREADAVLVGNWASMVEHGTELLTHVTEIAEESDTFSYLDAADPSQRDDEDELLAAIEQSPLDAWAMNDTEASLFSGLDDIEEATQHLAQATGTRVDVHAADRALTAHEGVLAQATSFDVEIRHLTGAGDAFNAGNLVAGLLGLEPEARLRFAHAVAGATISHPEAKPPTPTRLQEVWAKASDPTAQHST